MLRKLQGFFLQTKAMLYLNYFIWTSVELDILPGEMLLIKMKEMEINVRIAGPISLY